MLTYLFGVMQLLWLRLTTLRDERGGPTTETVIITAALAALAVVVTGIIVTRVTAKAESIQLGP